MSALDWAIVLAINGAIIAFGIVRSRDTKTSADWFLAGRTLPWWMIGLSLYATVIDSSDLVADAGGTYAVGMSYFITNWVGVVAGWVLLAHFVAPQMYRAGMYTNAEYLEARFSLAARVISALVQALYRMLVLGIISTTLYLVLAVVCGWGPAAWWVVVAVAMFATLYTALGGLKSVALTDALQSVVMVASTVALFFLVWEAVGGWGGIEAKLDVAEAGLSARFLHAGADNVEAGTTTPAWIVACAWVIVGLSYSIVNHTQSMRLFGARSEWDMKMAVVLSGVVLLVANFTNQMIGIMGRALYPDPSLMPLETALQVRDSVFPLLVREFTTDGLRGLVVAGVAAASFSTFDSIGSTVPSLLVRDVYARVFVGDREDAHYLRISRYLTPLVILGSFAFVPLLLQERGMLLVFVDWVSAFVVPLLAVYLIGTFTRAHRSSAVWGLAVGIAYGTLKLAAPETLPPSMANNFATSIWSLVLTAGAMIVVTALRGREHKGNVLLLERTGWLHETQLAASRLEAAPERDSRLPAILGGAVVVAGALLSFVLFW